MAAINYTYEDFQNAAQQAGLLSQFSDADLRLAQSNPNAGMGILQYKIDYQNATTAEQRAAANAGAESIRSSWGEYTGGGDGSGYHLNQMSPGSFTYGSAPTFNGGGAYSGMQQDLLNQQLNYGEYSYSGARPTYNNRYDDRIQDALDAVVNPEAFTYDPATDQIYQQYRKQYTREGDRATADALGAAAAASGGIPSSYAQTAAGQAANYYAAQMTDKIPELAQQAYNRYLNDYGMKQSALSALQGAEQSDYDKYLNELSQYNTDRNFDYNAWYDRYGMISNNLNTVNQMSDAEFDRYLAQLDQYNIDREFAYGQFTDEVASQQTDWERQYNLALIAAEMGDYSGLQALGIAPNLQNVNNMALAGSGKYTGGTGYYTTGGGVPFTYLPEGTTTEQTSTQQQTGVTFTGDQVARAYKMFEAGASYGEIRDYLRSNGASETEIKEILANMGWPVE